MTSKRSSKKLETIISTLDRNVLRAKTLHDIARNISFSTDLNTIYKTALDSSINALDALSGAFLIYNKKENGFLVSYQCGKKLDRAFFEYKGSFPEGLESISVDNSLMFEMLTKSAELKKLIRSLKSSVLIPICIKEDFYGVLEVGKKVNKEPYTAADVEFLVTLCSLISLSIENAEAQKELNYKIFELSTLYEISTELSSTLDIKGIQTAIIFCCMGVVGAKRGAIFLFDDGNSTITMNHAVNFPPDLESDLVFKVDDTLKKRLSKMHAPFFLSDLKKNTKEYNLVNKITSAMQVLENPLIIPQIIKDKLVGYLLLAEKINKDPYQSTEIGLLSTLSYQSALSITNAQSYYEVQSLAKKNADLYEELKVATEEKLKAERLATLGMVVSTIIHDIKNPLTSIRYFSSLLGQTDAELTDKQTYVNIIDSETDRLVGMIEDILYFASGGESSLNIKKCSVKNLIDEVCVVLEMNFKDKCIQVQKDTAGYAGNVSIDEEKLKRVLYNISYNARDALKGGGNITIKSSKNKNRLNISISDDGKGIPEKIVNTLFMPFVTHGKRQGTGLGLAISKKIVEQHSGELSFKTSKDKGTTFNIKLPLKTKQNS